VLVAAVDGERQAHRAVEVWRADRSAEAD